MGLALAAPAAAYLLITDDSKQGDSFVEAANLTQLKIGKPQEVELRTHARGRMAQLSRKDDRLGGAHR